MAISETHQQMIDKIMDSFDFGKVASVMEFQDWGWANDCGDLVVPDEPDIRRQARLHLKEAIKGGLGKDDEHCFASGGLVVLFKDGPNGYLRLSFEIEDYEANTCEL